METITIKTEELIKITQQLVKDKSEYTDVYISEPQTMSDGVVLPATLNFTGYDGEGGGVNYEGIDDIGEVDAFYKCDFDEDVD